MTAQPPQEQFTAAGNVRVTDLLTSIAKEIDRIMFLSHGNPNAAEIRAAMMQKLARRIRRLAEAIEKGK